MMQTIKGIYRNGKIELLELPELISEGKEVIVTYELVPRPLRPAV